MINIREGFSKLLQGSIIGRLLGAAGNIGLSRILGLTNFGSYSLYIQLIQTAESLCRVGLDYSIHYWIAPDPELKLERSRLLIKTGLILGVLFASITILCCLIYLFLPNSGFQGAHQSNQLMVYSLVLIALSCECISSIPWEIVLVQRKIRSYSLRIAFFGPLKVILSAFGAILFQLEGAILGWMTGAILQIIWLAKEIPFSLLSDKEYGRSFKQTARTLLGKAVPVYSGNLLGQIVFFPLLISLANEQGISSVGVLRVAQIIAQVFGILGGALVPILFVSMRSTKSPERKSFQLKRAVESIASISLLLFGILCIVDAPLTLKIFGDAYTQSVPVTRVLVSCVIIDSVTQIIQQSLLVHGKVLMLSITQNMSAIIAGLIGLFLIPYLGIDGYLACRLLYSLVPNIATLILAHRIMFKFSLDWKLICGLGLMIIMSITNIAAENESTDSFTINLSIIILILCLASAFQQYWSKYASK